jgi:hypothetical protein
LGHRLSPAREHPLELARRHEVRLRDAFRGQVRITEMLFDVGVDPPQQARVAVGALAEPMRLRRDGRHQVADLIGDPEGAGLADGRLRDEYVGQHPAQHPGDAAAAVQSPAGERDGLAVAELDGVARPGEDSEVPVGGGGTRTKRPVKGSFCLVDDEVAGVKGRFVPVLRGMRLTSADQADLEVSLAIAPQQFLRADDVLVHRADSRHPEVAEEVAAHGAVERATVPFDVHVEADEMVPKEVPPDLPPAGIRLVRPRCCHGSTSLVSGAHPALDEC